MKHAFWPVVLVLLAGCDNSVDSGPDRDQAHQKLAGQYQGVTQDEQGNPVLVELLAVTADNNLLRLSNARDHHQWLVGHFDAKSQSLAFGVDYQCQLQQQLRCQGPGLALTVQPGEVLSSVQLPAAGLYQLSGVQIEVDGEGRFLADFQGCHLAGTLTQAEQLVTVATEEGCGLEPMYGVVEVSSLYGDSDLLEVALPGHPLGGYWLPG